MVLDCKERFDSTFSAINDELKELKELRTNFRKLETDLVVTRNINKKLIQQLILVERKWLANQQNSRQTNKTPVESTWHFRKSWVCSGWWLGRLRLKNFNECNISCANIEACHRLKSKANPKRVIIKLSERANVFNILQRKKKLKSADITNVSLPEGSLVFKYQTLCSYYEHLWSLCKRLHLKKMILKNW